MESMTGENKTLVVRINHQRSIGKMLDKTWREIYEAFTTGSVLVCEGDRPGDSIYSIAYMTLGGFHDDYGSELPWIVVLNGLGDTGMYESRTADDYPEESYN